MNSPTYFTSTDKRCETSAIEEAIIKQLQDLGIPLVPQVKLGNNWVFDGAIDGTMVLVEVHGEYWHTLPEVQARDARKQQWADQNGYTILTIWEADYQNDPDAALTIVADHYAAIKTFTDAGDKGGKGGMDHLRRSDYGTWHAAFLAALGQTGIILDACDFAGVHRETVRKHRRDDPAFNEAFKDARRDAADRLRRRYHQRAEQQSDRAMEFLLKTLDPDEYGDGHAALLQGLMQYLDLSKLSNEQIERLRAGDDPIAVLLGG